MMQMRTLGTDLNVSAVGLGAWGAWAFLMPTVRLRRKQRLSV